MECFLLSAILIVVTMAAAPGASGATFTLVNGCGYPLWPGILANAGTHPLTTTGFYLPPGEARAMIAPPNWSGRVWARTGCGTDPLSGRFVCVTGDCTSGEVECSGNNANPPATLAEFSVGAGATQDFYDVSLVDGYNVPMIVQPSGGSGSCQITGCSANLNRQCPTELRVESGEACKSACEAFGRPEYCCSGMYASPATCKPSVYSSLFKAACPKSYSYAYDDPTSTFTCTGADYIITFCPAAGREKASSWSPGSATIGVATATETVGPGSSSSELPMGTVGPWLPRLTGRSSSARISCPNWFLALFVLLVQYSSILRN